ncbi:hypothetical protein BKA64DRAFT_655591, partial [Cadophora sp. MPI-SDFR-AT-0126]
MKSSIILSGVVSLLVGAAMASPTALEARQQGRPRPNLCDATEDCCFQNEAACYGVYTDAGPDAGTTICPAMSYCRDHGVTPRTMRRRLLRYLDWLRPSLPRL